MQRNSGLGLSLLFALVALATRDARASGLDPTFGASGKVVPTDAPWLGANWEFQGAYAVAPVAGSG